MARRPAFQGAERQGQDLAIDRVAEIGVDLGADPVQHAAARLPQHEVEQQRNRHAGDQGLQGRHTGVRHHAVIDLQHEDRHAQHDEIEEERVEQQLLPDAAEGPPQQLSPGPLGARHCAVYPETWMSSAATLPGSTCATTV